MNLNVFFLKKRKYNCSYKVWELLLFYIFICIYCTYCKVCKYSVVFFWFNFSRLYHLVFVEMSLRKLRAHEIPSALKDENKYFFYYFLLKSKKC